MTKTETRIPTPDIHRELDQFIVKFGMLRTLWALALRSLRPKSRPPDSTQILDVHLRRDIGLPPLKEHPQRWWNAPF